MEKQSTGFRVTEVWAFVCIDPDNGDEGVPAFQATNGVMMPLICASKDRLDSIRAIAESIAQTTGQKIKLVHFTNMEIIEEDILETREGEDAPTQDSVQS